MTYRSNLQSLLVFLLLALRASAADTYIRVNQLGYAPESVKNAIAFSRSELPQDFQIIDSATQKAAFAGKTRAINERWGEFAHHAGLDFSHLEKTGEYFIRLGEIKSTT